MYIPSRSSPKPGGNRACLCKDGKYSRKCCDGSLAAQGIGNVYGVDPNAPYMKPYYWGVSDTQLNANEIEHLILTNQCNSVFNYPNGDIEIVWNAHGKYLWIAYEAYYQNKTSWFNTNINQGNIGLGSDLFGQPTQFLLSTQTFSVMYKFYITNYATATSGSMILQE